MQTLGLISLRVKIAWKLELSQIIVIHENREWKCSKIGQFCCNFDRFEEEVAGLRYHLCSDFKKFGEIFRKGTAFCCNFDRVEGEVAGLRRHLCSDFKKFGEIFRKKGSFS